jgi:hypothetical protein
MEFSCIAWCGGRSSHEPPQELELLPARVVEAVSIAFHWLVFSIAMMLLLILNAIIAQLYFMKESMKVVNEQRREDLVRESEIMWRVGAFRRNDQRILFERSRDLLLAFAWLMMVSML